MDGGEASIGSGVSIEDQSRALESCKHVKDTKTSVICGSESATMLKDLVSSAERNSKLKIVVNMQLPVVGMVTIVAM